MTHRTRAWIGWTVFTAAAILACPRGPAAADVPSEELQLLRKTSRAFADVARKAVPAVVFIEVEKTVQVAGAPGGQYGGDPFGFFGDEFFERFFGGAPSPQQYRQSGQGSGFLITKDGYILTNTHVVSDADKITVKLHDGRTFTAKLVGTDPKSDVAVIKIDGKDFPTLEAGNSDTLDIGEWVIAVGSPFGLTETVTVGVVSAKGRSNIGMAEYEDFIQTDAAINPGNSGGPLLNIEGKVVGINTFIVTRSGGYMGVGFAIPFNMAAAVKDQLVKSGSVSRGYIGIVIRDMTEDLAEQFGQGKPQGILIDQVEEGSAGEKAGLKHGDIIVQLDGRPVESSGAFRNAVASSPPGKTFELTVFRGGKTRAVSVTTAKLPGEAAAAEGTGELFQKLGMRLENLTPQLAERFGYEADKGVIVTQVERNGQAAMVGIRPGYLVASVGQTEVNNVAAFAEAVRKSQRRGKVLLRILSERYAHYVTLSVE